MADLTLKHYAQQAIDVQDACNGRGVARAMVQAMDAIDRYDGKGTGHINQHPIVFMFLYKLMALNGHEPLAMEETYRDAEAKCRAIAQERCPVCHDAIKPGESTTDVGGLLVHDDCSIGAELPDAPASEVQAGTGGSAIR